MDSSSPLISKGLIVIGCSRSDVDYKHPNFHHFKTDITIEQNIIDLFKTIKYKFGKLEMSKGSKGGAGGDGGFDM